VELIRVEFIQEKGERIYVLSEGRLTGEIESEKADQESIMRLATS